MRKSQTDESCGLRQIAVSWALCIMYTRESSWNSYFKTMEPDRPQHDRSAASVTAQQYSSATFVSWHFQYCKKKKLSVRSKNDVISIYILYKFRKTENA
jgi:hypothetical protein